VIYLIVGIAASVAMLWYRAPLVDSALASARLPDRLLRWRPERDAARAGSALACGVSFAVLFGVAACRRGVGTDYWPRYVPFFVQVAHGWPVATDTGYVALNAVVAAFTGDYQWIFVVTSALTIGLVYRAIARWSVAPALSVFIFVVGGFYLESFNAVRQWLAIAILLNSMGAIVNRKPVRFLVLTAVAASFHASALIWLLAWPLARLRLGAVARLALVGLTAAAMIAGQAHVQSAISHWAPAYAWYLESDYGQVRAFDPYGTALAAGVLLVSTITLCDGERESRYVRSLLNLQGMQMIVIILASTMEYLFSRVTYYFTPVQILAVPSMLAAIRTPGIRRIATGLVLVGYAAAYYFKFMVWNSHGVLPYRSVF